MLAVLLTPKGYEDILFITIVMHMHMQRSGCNNFPIHAAITSSKIT